MNYYFICDVLNRLAKRKLKRIQKQWIKKRYPGFLEWIESKKGNTLKEKIFRIANNITTIPVCKVCGKTVKFNDEKYRYNIVCSSKCASRLDYRIQNLKEKNPMFKEENKEKQKQTMLEKYGDTNIMHVKEYAEKVGEKNKTNANQRVAKAKETIIKKEGSLEKHYKKIAEKSRKTNLKKRGVPNVSQDPEVQKKRQKTFDEKWNGHPMKTKEILTKQQNKIEENLGVRFALQSEIVKHKMVEKLKKEKGVTNISQLPGVRKKISDGLRLHWWKVKKPIFEQYYDFLFDLSNFKGGKGSYEFRCKTCGRTFKQTFTNTLVPVCPYCNPRTRSNLETKILDFLAENNIKFKHNDRSIIYPQEVDFLLDNIAIEVNGSFWHSSERVPKSYHQEKYLLLKEKGYQLLTFWEDQINNPVKFEIIKSMILQKTGKSKRIYARDCSIKEVSKSKEKEFLEKNHLQGFVNSKYCFGLYYENQLVMLISMGKPRFNKNFDWEILRFATQLNTTVVGGLSKLFSYVYKIYDGSYITYAHMDYSNGKSYEKIGFTFNAITEPGYFYVKDNIRYSRLMFQKHKLKNVLQKFDKRLTEEENMRLNGYLKCYDSGNMVFVKEE